MAGRPELADAQGDLVVHEEATDFNQRQFLERAEEDRLKLTLDDYRREPILALHERELRLRSEIQATNLSAELQRTNGERDDLANDVERLGERLHGVHKADSAVFGLTVLGGLLGSVGSGFLTTGADRVAGVCLLVASVAVYWIAWRLRPKTRE
jgi:hypothetical protein